MSRQLYEAAYAFIGHIRGGLASATVIGCGGFAALSGSSVASALTMGKVSLAEMDRFDYDPRLSTGVVAAGGTLGILIPPSTGFVIYAILTEQSIGRLFLAGVLPGLLLLTVFVLTITLLCWLRPEFGPGGPDHHRRRKAPRDARRAADPDGDRADHRRHLRRLLLADRGGGRRRGAGHPLRARQAVADLRRPSGAPRGTAS